MDSKRTISEILNMVEEIKDSITNLTVSEIQIVLSTIKKFKTENKKVSISTEALEKSPPAESVVTKEQKELEALGLKDISNNAEIFTSTQPLLKDDEIDIFTDIDIEKECKYENVDFESHTGDDEDEEDEDGEKTENPISAEGTGDELEENEDGGGKAKKTQKRKRQRLTSLGREKMEKFKSEQYIKNGKRRSKEELTAVDHIRDLLLVEEYEAVDDLIQEEIDKSKDITKFSNIEPLAAATV